MTGAQFRGGLVGVGPFGGLRRVPTFVRVVQDRETRAFDVLNDLDDEPRESEDVVAVYVLDATSRVHACARGANRAAGGWWVTYVHLPLVDVEALRTEQAWCQRLAAIVGVPVEVVLKQRAGERERAGS